MPSCISAFFSRFLVVHEQHDRADEEGSERKGGVTARLIAAEYSGLIARMSQEIPPPPPVPPVLPPPLPVASVPSPPPRPLGWGKALLLCVIFYSISSVSVLAQSLAGHVGWKVDGTVGALIDMICAWPPTLLLACVIAPATWKQAYPFTRFPPSLLAPLAISGFGLSLVLVEVSGWIPTPKFIEQIFLELMSGHPVAKLIALVVIAPMTEEMLFRGLIFREFARRYSMRHAIFGSAALFALFHLNPWQAVVAFPVGVLAAWLVLRTGSIIPGIMLHAALNFTSSFLLVPVGSLFGQDEDQIYASPHLPWPMLAVGGVATVVGLMGLWLCARSRQTSATSGAPAT
jgi:membrane protease YdiL (CAAX protease family)